MVPEYQGARVGDRVGRSPQGRERRHLQKREEGRMGGGSKRGGGRKPERNEVGTKEKWDRGREQGKGKEKEGRSKGGWEED